MNHQGAEAGLKQRAPGLEEVLRDTIFELMLKRFARTMFFMRKDPIPMIMGLESLRVTENAIVVLSRIRTELEAVAKPEQVERATEAARLNVGFYLARARKDQARR